MNSFNRIQKNLMHVRHFSKNHKIPTPKIPITKIPTHKVIENMSFIEYISHIYQKRFGIQEIPLGRWSLVEGDKVFDRSERANEDHCGACGDLYKNNNDSK